MASQLVVHDALVHVKPRTRHLLGKIMGPYSLLVHFEELAIGGEQA